MTNATKIVLQILKQKSQRILFSGIVVTFVLEFVNVMQGSREIYAKWLIHLARGTSLGCYVGKETSPTRHPVPIQFLVLLLDLSYLPF